MDIYTLLKQDHKKVNELFEKILFATDLDDKEDFFDEVVDEILVHTETEEKTFYTFLAKQTGLKEIIEHARNEHKVVSKLIDQIRKMSAEDDDWIKMVKKLKETIEHHVKEEEGEIFRKAKEVMDKNKAIELAEEMQQLKKEMELETTA